MPPRRLRAEQWGDAGREGHIGGVKGVASADTRERQKVRQGDPVAGKTTGRWGQGRGTPLLFQRSRRFPFRQPDRLLTAFGGTEPGAIGAPIARRASSQHHRFVAGRAGARLAVFHIGFPRRRIGCRFPGAIGGGCPGRGRGPRLLAAAQLCRVIVFGVQRIAERIAKRSAAPASARP